LGYSASTNPYNYVGNRPNYFLDPFGLNGKKADTSDSKCDVNCKGKKIGEIIRVSYLSGPVKGQVGAHLRMTFSITDKEAEEECCCE